MARESADFLKGFVFVLVLFLSGCALTEKARDRANDAFQAGEYKKAVNMYAVAAQNEEGLSLPHLADAYLGAEAYKKLIKYYTGNIKGYQENKDDNAAYYIARSYSARGRAYYLNGDRNKAIADYNSATGAYQKYSNAAAYLGEVGISTAAYKSYVLGELEAGKKHWDGAIAHYTKAIGLYPAFTRAYINRGTSYCEMGEYDQALSDFEAALNTNPESTYFTAWAVNNIGVVNFRKKLYGDAESKFNEAIKIDEDLYLAHANLGTLYRNYGEYDKARGYLNASLQIIPDFEYAKSELRRITDLTSPSHPERKGGYKAYSDAAVGFFTNNWELFEETDKAWFRENFPNEVRSLETVLTFYKTNWNGLSEERQSWFRRNYPVTAAYIILEDKSEPKDAKNLQVLARNPLDGTWQKDTGDAGIAQFVFSGHTWKVTIIQKDGGEKEQIATGPCNYTITQLYIPAGDQRAVIDYRVGENGLTLSGVPDEWMNGLWTSVEDSSEAYNNMLIGTWETKTDEGYMIYQFDPDGSGTYYKCDDDYMLLDQPGTVAWTPDTAEFSIRWPTSMAGVDSVIQTTYEIQDDTLVSGGHVYIKY
jgi:tetratricopeptide (TPR) repeat protein